jgi:hypothetical protein
MSEEDRPYRQSSAIEDGSIQCPWDATLVTAIVQSSIFNVFVALLL